MYGIINKCFGVDLRPESSQEIPHSLIPLLRDLLRLDEGDEIDSWDDDVVLELAKEIGESAYGWFAYCGRAIGFELCSWAYWELDGEKGIIAQAQEPNCQTTPELIEQWNDLVGESVQAVLAKHNIEPKVFWTTSTS